MSVWREEGGGDGWRALLASPEELVEIRMLQRGTFTGWPVGSDDFVDRLERQFRGVLRPHQGSRPSTATA